MDNRHFLYQQGIETVKSNNPHFEPLLYEEYIFLCDDLNSAIGQDIEKPRDLEKSRDLDFLIAWLQKNNINIVCTDSKGEMMYPHLIVIMFIATAKRS